MVGGDGGVFALGNAQFYGSLPGQHVTPAKPIVGMVATPDGKGYWMVGADGGVFAFGDAGYYNSLPGLGVTPNAPIVGMAATPDGKGYWLVGADGGIFAFGDAGYYNSLPGLGVTPNKPIVGMASTADGRGYWLTGADGGIFAFGDAGYFNSLPGLGVTPNKPIVGIVRTSDGQGYLLTGADGGVYAFGDAHFYGSMGGVTLNAPVVGITMDAATGGYWLAAMDGGIFSFNAPFHGSLGGSSYPGPGPGGPPTTLSTNYDWAKLVLQDGGWPASANNVTTVTQWMTSEEPTSNWFDRNNPLNNGYGSGGGAGLGSYPNLVVAAYDVGANLHAGARNGLYGYGAIAADFAASAAPSATARAIWNSDWASGHYGYGAGWFNGVAATVAAPAADWASTAANAVVTQRTRNFVWAGAKK
jgi:hypothetical protein